VLYLAPPEETVCGFAAEGGECFWGVEEACAKGDGGGGTEGGEFGAWEGVGAWKDDDGYLGAEFFDYEIIEYGWC